MIWISSAPNRVRDPGDAFRLGLDEIAALCGRPPPVGGRARSARSPSRRAAAASIVQARAQGPPGVLPVGSQGAPATGEGGGRRAPGHPVGSGQRLRHQSRLCPAASSPSMPPTSVGGMDSSSSTTCWSCARSLLRDRESRRPGAGPAPRALPTAPARRVPGHRPHPDRTGRPDRRRSTRPARSRGRRLGRRPGHPGPAVLRGRPEAVDLPVPAGRHLDCSWRPPTASARTVVAWSSSRRTSAPARPVIEWVNEIFAVLMGEPTDEELPVASQPALRRPLDASGRVPDRPAGGGRSAEPTTRRDHGRRAAARPRPPTWPPPWPRRSTRGGAWTTATADGGRPGSATSPSSCRPARRCRSSRTPSTGAGIPFRAESSSLVYATRAVRDLLMVLRARRRPDRPAAHRCRPCARRCSAAVTTTCSASRSEARRPMELSRPTSPTPCRPTIRCGSGSAYLRAPLRRAALAGAVRAARPDRRERRAFELGFADGRPRDVWRRMRFVIDQARAWSEATGGNLRQYLQWVDLQTAEGARVAEAVLPETDDDAVRIMTIHSAKGLEFPITIVSGMSTAPQAPARPRPRWCSRRRAASATGSARTCRPTSTRNGRRSTSRWACDERIRLLYVACTRARDHLVVSLHRKALGQASRPRSDRTNAELLVDGHGGPARRTCRSPATAAPRSPRCHRRRRRRRLPPFASGQPSREAALAPRRPAHHGVGDGADRRGRARCRASEPADPGLQKRPRDLDLPPWLKGRYGTAVGRAVHGVLQTIDLATGARAGRGGRGPVRGRGRRRPGRGRPRGSSATPWPRRRCGRRPASPHWREVYACTPVGGPAARGLHRPALPGPEGLVVVDYKTAGDVRTRRPRSSGWRGTPPRGPPTPSPCRSRRANPWCG